MDNEKLYNNCAGFREPDWSQFESLELGGCIDVDGDTTPDVKADDAHFFTVYGRTKDKLFEAITDCNSALEALKVGAHLSLVSGLPITLDYTLGAE